MNQPTIGSLFAGIGGFDLGFERAGFKTVWQCEIDKAAQGVLRRRFPDAALHSDVREVGAHNLEPVDVITFGSPCQDLSVAGKRAGLAGGRSGLFHEAARIIRELRQRYGKPDFAIWENVPGAFSSNDGRDFAAVVQAMVDLGARDVCWRVLDSRYFGVAQRRRRVFLVADFGGERSEQILFESESLRGNPAPRRKARKATAARAGAGAARGSWWDGGGIADTLDVSTLVKMQTMPERRRMAAVLQPFPDTVGALCADAHPGAYSGQDAYTGRLVPAIRRTGGKSATAWTARDQAPALTSNYGKQIDSSDTALGPSLVVQPIAFAQNTRDEVRLINGDGQLVGALAAQPGMKQTTYVAQPIAFHPTQDPISSTDGISHTMSNGSKGGTATVAFAVPMINMQGSKGNAVSQADGPSYTLNAMHGHDVHAVAVPVAFPLLEVGKRTGISTSDVRAGIGIGEANDPMFTLQAASQHGVAVCATGEITHTLTATSRGATEDGTGRGCPVVAQPYTLAERGRVGGATLEARQDGTANCLLTPSGGRGGMGVGAIAMPPMQVRRLTLSEAEALQSFPRNWTAEGITEDGKIKQQADGPRYKQLGNAVTVNVAEWIAKRLAATLAT